MAKEPARGVHSAGRRASARIGSAAKPRNSRFKSRSLWRLPIESRVVAWSLLAIVVVALAAVIAQGMVISVERRRCADLCAEREYAFKGYAPAGRFGTRPAVCTCSKQGLPVEVPMR